MVKQDTFVTRKKKGGNKRPNPSALICVILNACTQSPWKLTSRHPLRQEYRANSCQTLSHCKRLGNLDMKQFMALSLSQVYRKCDNAVVGGRQTSVASLQKHIMLKCIHLKLIGIPKCKHPHIKKEKRKCLQKKGERKTRLPIFDHVTDKIHKPMGIKQQRISQ